MMLGTDPAGRFIELITLIFDNGRELIIHAMKARPHYLAEL